MIHAIVQLHVKEFEKFWIYFQTRDFHLRQAHGSLGSQLFRHGDDPHCVTLLFQWESRSQMEHFVQDLPTASNPTGTLTHYPGGVTLIQPIVFLHKAGELDA